jgi:hypothetical protein
MAHAQDAHMVGFDAITDDIWIRERRFLKLCPTNQTTSAGEIRQAVASGEDITGQVRRSLRVETG